MNLGVLSLRGAEFKLVAAGPLGVPLKNFGYDAWNVLCGRPGPSLLVIWGDFCALEPRLLCKIRDYVFSASGDFFGMKSNCIPEIYIRKGLQHPF